MNSFEEEIAKEMKITKNNWNYKAEASYRLTDYDIRQIFATNHEVNLERDENGIPIPGTGRIITNEEKKAIFDYILENSYPLTRKIYNIVLRAYLNNEIEFDLNQGPKL